MLKFRSASGRGPHSAFLVTLLLASLMLAAGVAWQAHDAARSHRATAERVLADYATLAADELIRRITVQIGYYGYFPLITELADASEAAEGALPSLEALAARADDRLRPALPLVRRLFRVTPASVTPLEISGPAPDAELASWLVGAVAAALESTSEDRPFGVIHGQPGGRLCSVVWTLSLPSPASGRSAAVGFEVELDALPPLFRSAIERGALLPESLTGGEAGNDLLELSLVSPEGLEVLRWGTETDLGVSGHQTPGVEVAFGDAYQGILQGWVIRASIAPEAAPKLIIGGLPRSRLPLLLGLLSLTAGLIAAALFQLRRERELARLRSDFVSRVSHELRTPLTQIRMFAETLLLDRVRSPQERRRSLEIIDREARRLGHLVENILQFSRSERGSLRLAPERRELAPLVAELITEFVPLLERGRLADAERVRVTPHLAAGAVVPVDVDALRQILLNLLDNAVKYGPPAQEVVVGLTPVAGGVRLWVEDQGPGVPQRDRKRIWERFRRLDRDRDSAIAGAGIGLAVVRDLVTLHGGQAWVDSGERGGARFVIELPVAEMTTPNAPGTPAPARKAVG